jgi:4-oxalocrotonate tautomerase
MTRSCNPEISSTGINTMPVARITWFEGKDHKAKAAVAADVTESIVKHTGTDPQYIYVIFEDVKASDWAGSGQLFGADPDAAG